MIHAQIELIMLFPFQCPNKKVSLGGMIKSILVLLSDDEY